MELEKTVSNILKETFNQPYKWKIVTNQHDIIIAEFKSKNDNIEVRFNKAPWNDDNWSVDFVGKYTFDTTGLGDEFRVFATVIDVIHWFVKQHSPTSFSFAAEKDATPSRTKLYDKLVKRFAKTIKYKLNIYDSPIEKEYEFEAISS